MRLQEATTAEWRLGHNRVRTVAAHELNDLLVTHANLDRLSHLRLVEHQLQGLADHRVRRRSCCVRTAAVSIGQGRIELRQRDNSERTLSEGEALELSAQARGSK
jgi:hypothetical protein